MEADGSLAKAPIKKYVAKRSRCYYSFNRVNLKFEISICCNELPPSIVTTANKTKSSVWNNFGLF